MYPPSFGIGVLLPNSAGVADIDTEFTERWFSPMRYRKSRASLHFFDPAPERDPRPLSQAA
jgi:hypothetical protein